MDQIRIAMACDGQENGFTARRTVNASFRFGASILLATFTATNSKSRFWI
jgi:hypothetical protein